MPTITTTSNDVIFCGHGTYPGGVATCALPAGAELHIMQPVGSAMTDGPVTALVANRPIDRLVLLQSSMATNDFSALDLPTVMVGPTQVPNLILHDLDNLLPLIQAVIPNGPNHVITVNQDTNLATLLARPDVAGLIKAHVANGTRLRIFWAACTAAANNPTASPLVFHNARAVAFAASAYARANPANQAAAAAIAALTYAQLNPEDTAGTVQTAAAHDVVTSTQTHTL
jgi:hypothetical protein